MTCPDRIKVTLLLTTIFSGYGCTLWMIWRGGADKSFFLRSPKEDFLWLIVLFCLIFSLLWVAGGAV